MTDAALHLHPDRLLPADPTTRGDRPPAVRRGPRPADHLPARPRAARVDRRRRPVRRPDVPADLPGPLRHAAAARRRGAAGRLGAGGTPLPPDGARAAWRALCEHWVGVPRHAEPVLAGERARRDLRGHRAPVRGHRRRDLRPDRGEPAQPDFRPRALLQRFGIEVLATTDDPADDLAHHAAIRADAAVATRVLPTFRPDRYLEPARPDWPALVDALGVAADTDTGDYKGYIAALEERRRLLHRARRRLRRPQPRRRRHRAAGARRRGADLHRRPRRHARAPRRPRRCAGTCCWRWRGCPSRTGW